MSMNTLIAIIFKHEEDGAEKALQKLRSLESEYLIDLEDAVIAHRREDGKVRLTQSVNRGLFCSKAHTFSPPQIW